MVMLPRIKNVSVYERDNVFLADITLVDWSDATFPAYVVVLWSELDGVYCLAETAHKLADYTQLIFPGWANTCFGEMSYAEMKGRI